MSTYEFATDGSFVCLLCGMKSFNPNDIRERYCGHCHKFHAEEPPLCDFCMTTAPSPFTITAASHISFIVQVTVMRKWNRGKPNSFPQIPRHPRA